MNNIKLAGLNFFSFFAIGMVQSLLIVLLKQLGYEGIQRGSILGLGALFCVLLSIIVGLWSDSMAKLKPGYMLLVICFGILVNLALMSETWIIKSFYIILVIGIIRQITSHTETWIFQLKPDSFGQFHVFAALGLIISSLLSGYLFKIGHILWIGLICASFSLIAFMISISVSEKEKERSTVSIGQLKSLLTNKVYMKLMIVLLILMMIGFADQFVVVEKLLSLDSNPSIVSYKFALQSSAEIPLYLISKRLFERFDAYKLLLFASVMSGIKFVLYAFFQSPVTMILTALLQICTHPLILMSSKLLIQRITPEELLSTSQMFGFSIYFGCAGFITPILSSLFVPLIGYDLMLYLFAFSAALPILIEIKMKKELEYDTLFKKE